MRWIFLAPSVVLISFCFGQVSTVSLSFPGDQDGVYVEDSPIFDEFADGFSACAWFKVDSGIVNTSVAYAKPIFTKHFRIPLDENIGFSLKGWFYQGSQNLASAIGTTHQNASIGCEDCLLYDVWQHACVRVNSDDYALFLDGVKVDSLMLSPGEIYVDNDDAFQIGYRQDWNAGDDYYNWKGEIQEVAVWSRPIGDTEISDLLSCSPSHLGADLVGYWPLNEGDGNIVSDYSGNSLHGSILGDVAWEIEEIYSSCPYEELGCPDITACNYNAEVTANDGSCTYPGCNDSLACNFDALAGCDDGTCAFIEIPVLPDTINFCDSAYVELDSIYDFVLWSTGDTTTSLVVSESMELDLTVGTGQFCLSDMGFQELFSSDSTTFWLSPGVANWALANSEAHAVGGHLATFASTAEMSAVCSSLGGVHAIFGLYQDENSDDYAEPAGGWSWVTGEPFLWNAWDNNQPNNSSGTYGSEEVGHLRPNCLWNDVPEEFDGYQFIVETPFSDCGCTYSKSLVMIRLQDGCLDPLACNFDPQAECDNGSCDYTCCPGPGCCDTGTTWDYEIEKCVPINSCPEDLNYDGIIGVGDLLTLLSSFGTPCDPPVAEWTCGDPVLYHGYDYETVLIGEQCWFAENLRTTHYTTGAGLAQFVPDSTWIESIEPTVSYYNESIADCNGLYLENNDCCIPVIEDYGLLYNGYALSSPLALCPAGWHVAEKPEFELVFTFLLENGWDDAIGQGLFSEEVGFNAQKGGYRLHNGDFLHMSEFAYIWTNSIGPGGRWLIKFNETTEEMLWLDYSLPRHGLSVRCIKN